MYFVCPFDGVYVRMIFTPSANAYCHFFIHTSGCPAICLTFYPSVYPSVQPSIRLYDPIDIITLTPLRIFSINQSEICGVMYFKMAMLGQLLYILLDFEIYHDKPEPSLRDNVTTITFYGFQIVASYLHTNMKQIPNYNC